MRRLFHYIYTGLQDSTEPARGANKRNLSISNLCKVIDQKQESAASSTSVHVPIEKSKREQANAKQEAGADAALKADDLMKVQATIESSEVPTYGGQDQQATSFYRLDDKSHHKASRFDQQQNLKAVTLGRSLKSNSIIQLENEITRNKRQSKRQSRRQGASPNEKAISDACSIIVEHQRDSEPRKTADDGNQSSAAANKVEQLKKRIERLSRQAKKTINDKKQ